MWQSLLHLLPSNWKPDDWSSYSIPLLWLVKAITRQQHGYTCLFVCSGGGLVSASLGAMVRVMVGVRVNPKFITNTPCKHLEYGRGSFRSAEILLLLTNIWVSILWMRNICTSGILVTFCIVSSKLNWLPDIILYTIFSPLSSANSSLTSSSMPLI